MDQQIEEIVTRGVANIIPGKDELEKLLKSGKKLNVYLGIDCTATRIHLGNAVPLRKLQMLATLGHHITFLIGDFTSLIGDTSDKDTERPILTSEQIEANFKEYKQQAEKILDFSLPNVTVRHNSEWLSQLSFKDVVKLCAQFSFGDFASRELIAKRLKEGKHVALHEALYPVMQGYDSYFMDTDIQLGGTDQTFNMQAGRVLQRKWRDKESFVLTNVFLTGTDGRKMSKSWGNGIWLTDTPEDMYAKIMAVNDDLIIEYATLGSNLSMDEVRLLEKRLADGEHPMAVKKDLAHTIVSELHSPQAAEEAAKQFQDTVQNKELPTDIPELQIKTEEYASVEDVLVKAQLANSKSEAKRLIEQGGVTIDDEKVSSGEEIDNIKNGSLIRVGKRNFVKIIKK